MWHFGGKTVCATTYGGKRRFSKFTDFGGRKTVRSGCTHKKRSFKYSDCSFLGVDYGCTLAEVLTKTGGRYITCASPAPLRPVGCCSLHELVSIDRLCSSFSPSSVRNATNFGRGTVVTRHHVSAALSGPGILCSSVTPAVEKMLAFFVCCY